MGTYNIGPEEFLDGPIYKDQRISFECFLRGFEGDVSAYTIAEAWNKLCDKYEWNDKLKVAE